VAEQLSTARQQAAVATAALRDFLIVSPSLDSLDEAQRQEYDTLLQAVRRT